MPMTNYPGGFAAGLSVRGMPLLQTQPGNVFWVGNFPVIERGNIAGADGNPGTYQKPFATLERGVDACNQGVGDIIFVKPGHRELVSAGTIDHFDCAGVAIVGLGSGTNRPTFVFDTAATANINLRSANMSIQNFLFIANFADITSLITSIAASTTASIAPNTSGSGGILTVTVLGSGTVWPGATLAGTGVLSGTMVLSQISGTANGVGTYLVSVSQTVASTTITSLTPDFAIDNCEFRDTSSILNLLTIFTGAAVANSVDGFTFTRNKVTSLGTTAATTAIKVSTDQARIEISGNKGVSAVLNSTAAILAAGAAQLTSFYFLSNIWERPSTDTSNGGFVSGTGNAWTGFAADNWTYHADVTGTNGIWISTGHGTAFGLARNYSPITATPGTQAIVNPVEA